MAICFIGENDMAIYATWLYLIWKVWGTLEKNIESQANLKLFIEIF